MWQLDTCPESGFHGYTPRPAEKQNDTTAGSDGTGETADRLDAPAAPGRLSLLSTMTALYCRRGETSKARETANLGLSALDPDDSNHDRWRSGFEKQIESCGG